MTRITAVAVLAATLTVPAVSLAQQAPPPPPATPRPGAASTPRVLAPIDAAVTAAQLADEMRFRVADTLPAMTLFGQGGGPYNSGKDLLGRRDYEQAITRFDRVIAARGDHVDGALYWKAFAQFKLGRSDEALATLGQLRRDHAQSAYLADARTLEADVRKRSGQAVNPAAMDDDELKILAISGIQRSDPERAVPLLEGVLSATNSLRVKRQALYVLAMSTQPRAHQILLGYAKGAGNPDLQIEAIRYLATSRNKLTSADLVQIYLATRERSVKLSILGGSGGGPFTYALSEAALELATRPPGLVTSYATTTPAPPAPVVISGADLVRGRPGLLTPADLFTLYEKEADKDLRLQIVGALASAGAVDELGRVLRVEKDADIRRRALRTVGNVRTPEAGRLLADAYNAETDLESRRAIIQALGAQGNAEGLIAIARKETNLTLKTDIVRRLSDMAPKSKIAADYLMEIIK